MLIGYMRVSKAYRSQTTDLRRDALSAAGIGEEALYEEHSARQSAAGVPFRDAAEMLCTGTVRLD
jgi:hypothetical protein